MDYIFTHTHIIYIYMSYVLLCVNNSASFMIVCRKILPSTAVFV